MEVQSIAYSNDNGRSWIKYKNNPVIKNPGIKDFRDPKVFFNQSSNKWIALVACGNSIRFYSSYNLILLSIISNACKYYTGPYGVNHKALA
ncbi:glycoside hydrolase family protein [Acetivibrio cellulolyticus]|uniref:hypothetical protein n=1 Tax=Acetivibrio cellulolyticus TaxID=35830 RepID=UPI000474F1AB